MEWFIKTVCWKYWKTKLEILSLYIKVASASLSSACLSLALAWKRSLMRADFSWSSTVMAVHFLLTSSVSILEEYKSWHYMIDMTPKCSHLFWSFSRLICLSRSLGCLLLFEAPVVPAPPTARLMLIGKEISEDIRLLRCWLTSCILSYNH